MMSTSGVVITPIAAPLDRLELWEFLLPIAKHMGFDAAQIAYFADREIALSRNRGSSLLLPWFQQ